MEKYEFWNKCCQKWALNMLINAELSCKSTERSTFHDKTPFISILHWLQFMEGILVVQWFRPFTLTTGGMGSIPGWGSKIPRVAKHDQKY